MEELIFFAVIIFFSIVESIARTRKQRRQQQEGSTELPSPPGRARGSAGSGGRDLPTYDQEPSYDDRALGDRGARPEPAAQSPRPAQSSSEVLLPGDLLKELERLAGLRKQQPTGSTARPLELPKESPPLQESKPAGRSSLPSKAPRRTPLRSAPKRPVAPPAEHAVHLSHVGYGTDPSSRAPSREDGLDPLAAHRTAEAAAVLALLRSRDPSKLRQAIVLEEVLGPPVALRE